MRRLLTLLLILLPLAPLAYAFKEARVFVETASQEQVTEKGRFVLEATAAVSEPILSRPTLSRTELFEVGRRVDDLREVESVLLFYRSPGDARLPEFELSYATPGKALPDPSEFDDLLGPLVSVAREEANDLVGDTAQRLRELGAEIVEVVVEGRNEDQSSLERLDREFKLLYEAGNARLAEVSTSLQQVIEIPTGRSGTATEVYFAQPVLSFSRSRSVEVLGVILLKAQEATPDPARGSFLRRLGGALLIAFALFCGGLLFAGRERKAPNRV
ncbi:MAG: hypothetical protein ACLFPV_02020 [Spirochaetaceae bacterium]